MQLIGHEVSVCHSWSYLFFFIHSALFRARSLAANLIHQATTLPACRMTDKSVSVVYHCRDSTPSLIHSFDILDSAMEYIW